MTDEIFKKQLEAFGIESALIVEGDITDAQRQLRLDNLRKKTQEIMSDMAGREWIQLWLDICGIDKSPFVGDPYYTALYSGIQRVGHIMREMVEEAAPQDFYLMRQEKVAREYANIKGKSEIPA